MKYLELDISQIHIGDMFFVELKNLCGVKVCSEYVEEDEEYKIKDGQWPHSLCIKQGFLEKNNEAFDSKDEEIRMNFITLVKYLGNGEFLENFTGILVGYQDFQEIKVPSWENFMWAYNEYIKTPLLVKTNKLMPLNAENCLKFVKQLNIKYNAKTKSKSSKIKNIENTIYLMNSISYNNVIEIIENIREHDEAFAYAEDMIRTLKIKT